MKNRISVLWTNYTDMTLKQQLTIVIGGILTIVLVTVGIYMAWPRNQSNEQNLMSDQNVTVKDINMDTSTQNKAVDVPAEVKAYEAPADTNTEPVTESNAATTEVSDDQGIALTNDGYVYEVDDTPAAAEQTSTPAPSYTAPAVDNPSGGNWDIPHASDPGDKIGDDSGKGESQ